MIIELQTPFKSPLTTELSTLGPIFEIRRQNYQNNALVEKIFWSKMVYTLPITQSLN